MMMRPYFAIVSILGLLVLGCGTPPSVPVANTMPASCMPGPPGPYYPFPAPTQISDPGNRSHHIAVIEQRDPGAHLFRNHPGLKSESFFAFVAGKPLSVECHTVSYRFNIPVENGRKIIRGTWYVADDTSATDDSVAVRWADASVIDLTTADTIANAMDSHGRTLMERVKYRAWKLTHDEMFAILSMPEPVFIPTPSMPVFEARQIAQDNTFELILNPNRGLDTSDTDLIVNGSLPDTLSQTLAATLAVAALAAPEVSGLDATEVYAKYRVPRQLRIVPPALKMLDRRYNPIIYLYPYAPDRILAKVGRAFFPQKDDPTIITERFAGWSTEVVDVILVWDGSCWRGHRLAVISGYLVN
jgi:hypothetical protein